MDVPCRTLRGPQSQARWAWLVKKRPRPGADHADHPGPGDAYVYLVDADGKLVKRWATKVTPEDPDVIGSIEAQLR